MQKFSIILHSNPLSNAGVTGSHHGKLRVKWMWMLMDPPQSYLKYIFGYWRCIQCLGSWWCQLLKWLSNHHIDLHVCTSFSAFGTFSAHVFKFNYFLVHVVKLWGERLLYNVCCEMFSFWDTPSSNGIRYQLIKQWVPCSYSRCLEWPLSIPRHPWTCFNTLVSTCHKILIFLCKCASGVITWKNSLKFQVPIRPCSQPSTSSPARWICHDQPLPDISIVWWTGAMPCWNHALCLTAGGTSSSRHS
jgi:hypothetical protein